MAKIENLPFPRGTSFFDGQTAPTSANYDTVTKSLEGKEYYIEDVSWNAVTTYTAAGVAVAGTFASTKVMRTARLVKVRIMRNVSGVALQGGNLCAPYIAGTDGRFYLGRTIGYTYVPPTTQNVVTGYGIDEFLPSAGVPTDDLFYAVVEGPFLGVSSPLVTDYWGGTTQIVVGDWLVAATGAASTNTTNITTAGAGKLASQTFNAATTGISQVPNLSGVQGRIGRALSALTSANTCSSMLIDMTRL